MTSSSDLLIEQLADGELHATQALLARADIQSAELAAELEQLRSWGIDVVGESSEGFRLASPLDLLSAANIRAGLSAPAARLIEALQIHRSIDSTNAELLRQKARSAGAHVCLAECQTAGRGRRGKHWVSPFASSIYLSMSWRFDHGVTALEGLSLAVGVLVCEALAKLGVKGLQLKWPNDVLIDGAKLAGILVEMQGDAAGPCTAVVGVGVNVALPAAESREIGQRWSELATHVQGVTRSEIVAELLNHLLPALAEYQSRRFSPWQDAWNRLHAHAGQSVTIDNAGQKFAGTAQGVDERGALIVTTAQGEQRLSGGEVSLRAQHQVGG